ncbi:MAG TPA: hypothetical protein VNP94_08050 [Actinomycetota bacterium]|nr:hypothetical protein [Actinomycetota bacterium]
MDRRTFLRKAGLGSVAVASAPGVLGALATPAWADDEDEHRFRFVTVSSAGTIDSVTHLLIMNGNGRFGGSGIEGFGTWAHVNGADPNPATNLLASGRWRTLSLVSFTSIGTYAEVLEAGVLEARIFLRRLRPTRGSFEGTLKVVCNIGPGGLSTGQAEGVTVTIDGAPVGPFAPLSPALGLTIFIPPIGD